MNVAVRLDLHVHSRFSPDSRAPVRDYVSRVAALGLQGFALTDHNSVAGHRELAGLARTHAPLLFLPGVEVSTREGHLLAYGVGEAPPAGQPLSDSIDWVRDHGGEAVLAHPFRWSHGVGARLTRSAPVAAIEVVNGHNAPRANLRASAAAAARHLGGTGGGDAHDPTQLGRAYTEFPEGASSVDDLLESIRRGSTRAGGSGSGAVERLRLSSRSVVLRALRGFRPI